jgi:hypothetical protein
MTLLITFPAIDGMLLVSDGRTSERTVDGRLHPTSDTTVKSTSVPTDFPAVIMTNGRATINRANVIDIILAGFERSVIQDCDTVVDVAELARQRLANALIDSTDGIAVEIIVAGYSTGETAATIRRFTISEEDCGQLVELDGSQVHVYPSSIARPHFIQDQILEASNNQSLEEFYAILDEYSDGASRLTGAPLGACGGYRHRSSPLAEVRKFAEGTVIRLIESYRDEFDKQGIGSNWLVHEVQPAQPVKSTTRRWGPFSPNSKRRSELANKNQ